MFKISKTFPSGEEYGFLNGSSDKLQQLNGSLVKGTFIGSFNPPHSSLCSEYVM